MKEEVRCFAPIPAAKQADAREVRKHPKEYCPPQGKLPTRQRQVLEGMWAGKCTKEIAVDLGISAKTVEFHRMALYQRFEVMNPVTLCRCGLAVGEIRLDQAGM